MVPNVNIQERLAAALHDHGGRCDRCGERPSIVRVDVFGDTKRLMARSHLCRACHTDHAWFMTTPPEIPNISTISSDSLSPITEVPHEDA